MKIKNFTIELIAGFLLLLMGMLLLVFPSSLFDNINYLFFTIMIYYSFVKISQYFLNREEGDYENLFTALACVLSGTIVVVLFNYDSSKVISLSLVGWVIIMSIVKLIKIEYLIQKNNSMYYIRIISFSLFGVLGLLTSINIFFSISIESIMLGFFFTIVGLINLLDPIVSYIVYKTNFIKRLNLDILDSNEKPKNTKIIENDSKAVKKQEEKKVEKQEEKQEVKQEKKQSTSVKQNVSVKKDVAKNSTSKKTLPNKPKKKNNIAAKKATVRKATKKTTTRNKK